MKTPQELESKFVNLSIVDLEMEAKKLCLSGDDNLSLIMAIRLLSERISEYRFNNFIQFLQI